MIVVDGAIQGVGFAVVAPAMKRLLAGRRSARTPWLGLAGDELWESKARVRQFPAGAEGMVVTVVVDGGPASRAGIEKGWLITRSGGDKVRFRDDLLRTARARKPGDRLELEMLRPDGGEPVRAALELGCMEDRRR
jgi:S1-C subfamily serine protease